MALQSNPPITMAQIRAEFGAPANTPLHDFYRGGPWVPNISQNSNVPPQAPIRMQDLLNATKYQPIHLTAPIQVNWEGQGNRPPLTFYTTVDASVSGGNPNPTIRWTFVSGSSQIANSSNNTLSGRFSCRGGVPGQEINEVAVYQLAVTDGVSSDSKNVTFNFFEGE